MVASENARPAPPHATNQSHQPTRRPGLDAILLPMNRPSFWTSPSRLPLVGASVLSADFAALAVDCRAALDAGANFLHLDVMDGHFVPNLTMGPELVRRLRAALTDVFFDVHLMVNDPAMFIGPFADAGADHLTFHREAVNDPPAVAQQIHKTGMTAGLAINPPTDVQAIMPYLDVFELILIMSVNPGFSGQSFHAGVLPKARAIKPHLRPDQRLQFDGGVNAQTAEQVREAGGDVLVAASAIFGAADYHHAIAAIRGEKVMRAESALREAQTHGRKSPGR